MPNKVDNVLRQIRMYRIIKRSGLFDREYDLRNNLAVAGRENIDIIAVGSLTHLLSFSQLKYKNNA